MVAIEQTEDFNVLHEYDQELKAQKTEEKSTLKSFQAFCQILGRHKRKT